MGRKPRSEDECPICGQYISVIASGYRNEPFLDGKKYHVMCFTCACTVKGAFTFRVGENLKPIVPGELYTVQEMMEDGFDKKEAEISLKAVKAAIAKSKKTGDR
jgi:hypothetical protein